MMSFCPIYVVIKCNMVCITAYDQVLVTMIFRIVSWDGFADKKYSAILYTFKCPTSCCKFRLIFSLFFLLLHITYIIHDTWIIYNIKIRGVSNEGRVGWQIKFFFEICSCVQSKMRAVVWNFAFDYL